MVIKCCDVTIKTKLIAKMCSLFLLVPVRNQRPVCSNSSLVSPLVSTCACVEYYGRALETLIKKVTVCCIHGKMKQKRNKIFADFRALKR